MSGSLQRPSLRARTQIQADIAPKQIELLKALVPGLARVAELDDPKYAGGALNASYDKATASLVAGSSES